MTSTREHYEAEGRKRGLNERDAFNYGWAVVRALTLGPDMAGYELDSTGRPAITVRNGRPTITRAKVRP